MKKICYAIIVFACLLSACEKEYKPDLSKISQTSSSIGNLTSATPATVDYLSGIAVTNNHKVAVQVNITTVGTYSIHTDTINSVWFDGNGTFNNTGLQTVNLQAHGTPDTSGICNFTIKYGISRLSFSVEIFDWWEFEAGGIKHTGKIDTAAFFDDGSFSYLDIEGSKPNTDTTFEILPFLPSGNTLTSGKYGIMEPRNQIYFEFNSMSSAGPAFYHAEPNNPVPPNDFILQLTYNTTTKIAEGTFGGIATNDIGMLPTLIQITNGRFRVKIRP